jgi:hypothetical protein
VLPTASVRHVSAGCFGGFEWILSSTERTSERSIHGAHVRVYRGSDVLWRDGIGFKQSQQPGHVLGSTHAEGDHGEVGGADNPKGHPVEATRSV